MYSTLRYVKEGEGEAKKEDDGAAPEDKGSTEVAAAEVAETEEESAEKLGGGSSTPTPPAGESAEMGRSETARSVRNRIQPPLVEVASNDKGVSPL